ncbi:MAG: response regulator [Candidatus Obscuribacterales bacterium]|nr:response regulator [Candidatus Obscuribacterales bacterium]
MSHTDKILVVEDDDTLRLLTTKQLTRLGFPSDAVEDGSHALRKTAELTYRLILMDVQMPQIDGIEATIAIRQAEQANNRERVPIIAMTANPDRSLCLNADMDDFLFKPVMLPELEQLLKKWLSKEEKSESKVSSIGAALQSTAASHAGASVEDLPMKSIKPKFGFAASATQTTSSESSIDTESSLSAPAPEISSSASNNEPQEIIDASGSGPIIE